MKLKNHYGNKMPAAKMGRSGVLCFTECMKDVLTDEWYAARKSDLAANVRRLIVTAALIIRNDIRSQAVDCQVFSSAEKVISRNCELVPDTLHDN